MEAPQVVKRSHAQSVSCPDCGAQVGERCKSATRRGRYLTRGVHPGRKRRASGEMVKDSFGVWFDRELRQAIADALTKKES